MRSLVIALVTLAPHLVAAQITSEAIAAPASSGTSLFTALSPAASGVDFTNPIDKKHPTKRLYLGAFACGGVAIGDLNGDSQADLFFTSGPRRNRLYINQGGMKFEDKTQAGEASHTHRAMKT